ncbi:response regulator transcription factor [Roseovarius sp. SCSIO 43702]|nr:response regulator transcription factor [Roseovarius sp. SCSIO 43702]
MRLIRETDRYPGSERVGFLPMNVGVDCWLSVLRLVALGQRYFPSELIDRTPEPVVPAPAPTAPEAQDVGLTVREREVLSAAAEGKQNKLIADELGVSEHTVKLHMHHIIRKLGVKNRTEATIWHLAQGASGIRQS